MSLALTEIITLLRKHAAAEDHVVFIDGDKRGKCSHASFRVVFSLHGVEFPLEYAYEEGASTTTFRSRVRREGLPAGGHEQILVNDQDVEHDDVIIGSDDSAGVPGLYVEFKYSKAGNDHRVKFVAPMTAFH